MTAKQFGQPSPEFILSCFRIFPWMKKTSAHFNHLSPNELTISSTFYNVVSRFEFVLISNSTGLHSSAIVDTHLGYLYPFSTVSSLFKDLTVSPYKRTPLSKLRRFYMSCIFYLPMLGNTFPSLYFFIILAEI